MCMLLSVCSFFKRKVEYCLRRVESRATELGCRYLKTSHLSSKGLLRFKLTGEEFQVSKLCGLIISVIDTTYSLVLLAVVMTVVGLVTPGVHPPVLRHVTQTLNNYRYNSQEH